MRVSLGDPVALQRREQNFLDGRSPDDGTGQAGEQGRNGTIAGLTSDEVVNATQWVDAVAQGLRDATLMAHERA
eukprot:9844832-Alexandrium_andersonii.AAC.1